MHNSRKRELSLDPRTEKPDGSIFRGEMPRERTLSITASAKMTKSSEFFKTTRVDSCSYVAMKNGIAQAIPFRPKPKVSDYVPFATHTETQ